MASAWSMRGSLQSPCLQKNLGCNRTTSQTSLHRLPLALLPAINRVKRLVGRRPLQNALRESMSGAECWTKWLPRRSEASTVPECRQPSDLRGKRADTTLVTPDSGGSKQGGFSPTLLFGLAALLLAGGVSEPAIAADLNSSLGPNLAASFDLFEDLGNLREGFVSAFLLIFFSEIGDKTFFIAVLLALKRNKAAVFAGTFGALAVMTFITVILGRVFHVIDEALPFDKTWDAEIPLDDVAAVLLLIYFGLSTLRDAYNMDDGDGDEEKESAEAAVASFGDGTATLAGFDLGTVAATFALVFAAEWGDKSFFSTIALAAAGSPLGVVGGAVAGHGIATILAVAGGSILSRYISPKVIGYAGGSLFLVFAAVTLFEITSKLP